MRWSSLLPRLIVGYGLMMHGYLKLERGVDVFVAALNGIGVPFPHLMAWVRVVVALMKVRSVVQSMQIDYVPKKQTRACTHFEVSSGAAVVARGGVFFARSRAIIASASSPAPILRTTVHCCCVGIRASPFVFTRAMMGGTIQRICSGLHTWRATS